MILLLVLAVILVLVLVPVLVQVGFIQFSSESDHSKPGKHPKMSFPENCLFSFTQYASSSIHGAVTAVTVLSY